MTESEAITQANRIELLVQCLESSIDAVNELDFTLAESHLVTAGIVVNKCQQFEEYAKG